MAHMRHIRLLEHLRPVGWLINGTLLYCEQAATAFDLSQKQHGTRLLTQSLGRCIVRPCLSVLLGRALPPTFTACCAAEALCPS